jgi:hypothetical protein
MSKIFSNDVVSFLGVNMAMPAIWTAILGLVFLALAVIYMASRKFNAVSIVKFLIVGLVVPWSLMVYTIHCLVVGRCHVWAWILVILLVFYGGSAALAHRMVAPALQLVRKGAARAAASRR